MKNFLGLFLCLAFVLHAAAEGGVPVTDPTGATGAPSGYGIVERGPNHRVWSRITWITNALGEALGATNSFTELQTGLHFVNPETGQYEESNPAFEITPDGFAVARRGQHQVILSPNLNTPEGVVDFKTPDGHRMRSGVIGLNLFDPVSGRSLQIASVTNSIGEQTAPNEITYFNAFDTLHASVRIRNERHQFHQDVLLEERLTPAHLAALGFDASTARLEVWTAFPEAPEPAIRGIVLKAETNAAVRATMAEPDETDQILTFGRGMQMPTGEACVDGVNGDKAVEVFKTWKQMPDGKRYLIEAASYSELKPLLDSLPTAKVMDPDGPMYAGRMPPKHLVPVAPNKYQIAKADADRRAAASPQLVWDYVTVNMDQSNFVFQADSTYYVSATVNLGGVTIIEGASVIKYAPTNSARINIIGTLDSQSTAYQPAVFTAKDDNTAGETISGSSGNPSGTYATYAVYCYGPSAPIQVEHWRVAYANNGLFVRFTNGHSVRHSQFLNCGNAVMLLNTTGTVENVLFYNVGSYALFGGASTLSAAHLTANQVSTFLSGGTLALTNSLLVNVTNMGAAYTSFSNATNSDSGTFQAVGAGSHYLAANSTNRNAGTTNLAASLLAALKLKTTYPPLAIMTNITGDTQLSPYAGRDSDTLDSVDRGFHYDPLDFVVASVTLSNATLTLTNGVVLGTSPGTIDFRISNAIVRRQPERSCLYETARIARDVGSASSQDCRLPETESFSA